MDQGKNKHGFYVSQRFGTKTLVFFEKNRYRNVGAWHWMCDCGAVGVSLANPRQIAAACRYCSARRKIKPRQPARDPAGASARNYTVVGRRELTFRGKTQGVIDWERELGFSPGVVYARLARGWPTERALKTPQLRRWKYEQPRTTRGASGPGSEAAARRSSGR